MIYLRYSILICAFIIALAATPFAALIPVQIDLSIDFIPPDPIFPTDPIFPSFTDGVTSFGQDVLLADSGNVLFPALFSALIPSISAGSTWHDTFYPSDPCDTERDLFFLIAGLSGGFGTFAYPSDPTVPTGPPIVPPLIDLGSFVSAGTSVLSQSGPLYAFDEAVRVGTWEVTVTAVPEPSTILLLGAGLAAVGMMRRRFKK